jgi:hypothetical protein
MAQTNGSQPVNGSEPLNGSEPVHRSEPVNGSDPVNGAVLPTSLDDFLSADEWRDLRAGLHDLARTRARNEAAAADLRI